MPNLETLIVTWGSVLLHLETLIVTWSGVLFHSETLFVTWANVLLSFERARPNVGKCFALFQCLEDIFHLHSNMGVCSAW